MKFSRSEFLKTGILGLGSALVPASSLFSSEKSTPAETLNVGLASYTLRKFNLDETIAVSKRLGLQKIALKSMHMPINASADELKSMAAKVSAAGLQLYGAGVIYMKTQDEVAQAFTYAKNAGIPTIIGVPNHDLLKFVEEQVKSSGIRLAIHNHGPGDDLYRSPDDVYSRVKDLDKRIGLCIDVGHVQRIGQNPAEKLEKYHSRLYDIHLKDVDKNNEQGKPIEIGRGVIDIPAIIKTLKKIGYKETIAIEYEKDEQDPVPGLAESTGYVRAVIKMS
ncbi:sugar phosphate isomerase/epimerase [Pollutibacter soli]|uniref:sugar phosphate isomerase/epimerase family protein n=1 Tax=Pollutibacter soli TaxID=3034157 RepID=UPI00301367E7